jgi:ring-1,2-phenylacetyl-CoA epoxidase subunit PaaD
MVNAMSAACTASRPKLEEIWVWLRQVVDPEIPIVSVVDLGIVRDVVWSGNDPDLCIVTVTPTYSACPATSVIREHICNELEAHGMRVQLQIRLSPPWTTDWISEEGKEKLRGFGIAPPKGPAVQPATPGLPVLNSFEKLQISCPRCGSQHTTVISQFGSTLCKALYRCDECLEPFDYFKCH